MPDPEAHARRRWTVFVALLSSRRRRRAAAALLTAVAICAGAPAAEAVERDCPAGQAWSPAIGACTKKAAVVRRSPAEAYYAAIDRLEGKGGAADPARAGALLATACGRGHAPSCTLLGYLHENGRLGATDARRALGYYDRGCGAGDGEGCVKAGLVHARGLLGTPDPAAAIAPLTRGCELGAGDGCVELAKKYEQALGVERDPARAGQLYARAFERLRAECPKHGPSCYRLGLLYLDGTGAPADPPQARAAFDAGCGAGSGDACYALGLVQARGFGGPADRAASLATFQRACTQYDSADGCHEAGVLLAGEDDPDRARLVALATRACQLSASACDLDAYLHATGKGGVKDDARATASYVKACQAGNPLACSSAASRIARGTGVAADGRLAVSIWERACETGAGDDCYEAGLAYRDGELIAADRARAFDLFRRGCVRGSPAACEEGAELSLDVDGGAEVALALYRAGCEAGRGETCTRLGDVLRDGEGVPADATTSAAAYGEGCTARHADAIACTSLARAYQRGAGVERDPARALAALARGCRLGDNAACFELDGAAAAAKADDATRAATMATLAAACDDEAARVEDACLAAAQILAGDGVLAERNPRRARALTEASCRRGYPHACLLLADLDLAGIGAVASSPHAAERYAALCDDDLTEACWKLGNLLAEDRRHDDAARLFERACADGMGAGCNSWGFALFTGKGAPWSAAGALAAYRKACELGDAYGCANVGELVELGVGAPPDREAAAAAYRQACTDDTGAGCARLARLYEEGAIAEARDIDRARVTAMYRRACEEEGAAEACHALARRVRADGGAAAEAARLDVRAVDLARELADDNPYFAYVLGTFHHDGVALDVDRAAAARLHDAACDGREPLGCLAAGEAYLAGDGVPADRARAAVRFERACAAGVDLGCTRAAAARGRLPMSGRGCACRAGGDAGAAWWLPALLGALARRRRRPRACR
jgi:hypothetical protein